MRYAITLALVLATGLVFANFLQPSKVTVHGESAVVDFKLAPTGQLSPNVYPTCDDCGYQLSLLCMDDGLGPDTCIEDSILTTQGICSCWCWGGELAVSVCVDPAIIDAPEPWGIQESPEGFPTGSAEFQDE